VTLLNIARRTTDLIANRITIDHPVYFIGHSLVCNFFAYLASRVICEVSVDIYIG